MNDFYEIWIDELKAQGVPEAMALALANLDREVAGLWKAEGWKKPKAQARFIESRKAYYAGVFHGLGFEFSEEPPAELGGR